MSDSESGVSAGPNLARSTGTAEIDKAARIGPPMRSSYKVEWLVVPIMSRLL